MAVLLKTTSVRVSFIQIIQVRVQNKGKHVWKSRYVGDVSTPVAPLPATASTWVPHLYHGRLNDNPRYPAPVLRLSILLWPMPSPSARGFGSFSRSCSLTSRRPPLSTVTMSLQSTSLPTPFIIVARSILSSTFTSCESRWLLGASAFFTFLRLSSLPML